MDSVILFDPSIRSLNIGDEIIMTSAEEQLNRAGILKDKFILRSATHAPIVTFYQNTRLNPRMKFYDNAQYKFICGSNLLWKDMLKPRPVFNVNPFNCMPYEGSVLLGVGTGNPTGKTNTYTRHLYARILSKKYIHSVRDEKTAQFVRSLGYDAIDTGCPTMWKFTPEFCADIPTKKANNVVFTLTDYGTNRAADQKMIDTLLQSYHKVYFWIQGAFDKEYFDSLQNIENISIVPPTLKAFSEVLSQDDIEYVGTRLHAGMYAMQHKKRTITIAIDNRVRDMKETYAINVVERDNLDVLPTMINSNFSTDIKLKSENIKLWLEQFR